MKRINTDLFIDKMAALYIGERNQTYEMLFLNLLSPRNYEWVNWVIKATRLL